MDFGKMKELYELRKKAKDLQRELRQMKIEAEKEGIKVVYTGEQKLDEIEIDDKYFDLERKYEMLRILKQVIEEAQDKTQKQAAAKMKDIGGFDIPGLG